MAKLTFKKATKSQAKARIALCGPAGSGKTWTALAVATGLVNGTGKRIAVADSERGSASLYAGDFDFDVLEVPDGNPTTYIEIVRLAEKAGYGALVIDSFSNAWAGQDGALEQADIAAKKGGNNKFTAWREVTPVHNEMVDVILSSTMHIVATLRVKTEWSMEKDENGKIKPVKIGLQPVQRAGTDYEFTIVGDMNLDHDLIIGKTRMSSLAGKLFRKPGRELGETILAWLNDGEPVAQQSSTPKSAEDVRLQLEAIAALVGGRENLIAKLGPWPKTLAAARDYLAKAFQLQHEATQETADVPLESKPALTVHQGEGKPSTDGDTMTQRQFLGRCKAEGLSDDYVADCARMAYDTEPNKLDAKQRAALVRRILAAEFEPGSDG